ncbi:MAG: DUF11 domain-containing protein [Methanobacteriota archaeon]|nr:MAG: DUF11 domain-containing protein [Euryarchaeota archaeon]
MSRRLPTSPLAVTFFVLLLAAALFPFLSPPAAAFGERVYESNTVISGTNHLSVDSSDSAAQSFLTSASYRLLNLTLRLRNSGGSSNTIKIAIQSDASGQPSGTILAQVTFAIPNTALANVVVTFPSPPSLGAGVQYWIVATSSTSIVNPYEWHHSNANTYPNGQAMTNFGGGGWTPASPATDLYFVAYGRQTASNLTATLRALDDEPNPGDTVTFRLYLNNTGNNAARGAWLNDTLLPGMTYVSDTAAAAGSSTPWPSFTFADLTNGARSFDLTCRVNLGTEPGTILTKALAFVYVDDAGTLRTPPPAQASVLVGTQSKQLYLDPKTIGSAQRLDPARPMGGGGSQFNETLRQDGSAHDFDLDPVLARPFRALASNATLFLDSASHDVKMLQLNLTLTDWNGVTFTPVAYTERALTTNQFPDYQPFTFQFPAFDHTFPSGGRIRLTVRNLGASQADAVLAMNSSFAASVVNLRTTTYVRIDQIDTRDAVGPATAWSPKDALVVQANVSDPFGSSEIASARINLTAPSGAVIANYTAMALFATDPANPSAWKVFRFTLFPPLAQGTYHATVTAMESNGVLDIAESSALVRAPSFTLSKTTTSSNVRSGDRYTYDLWFNNTGSGPAGQVWLNDSLPSELTFLTSSDPGAMTGNYNWTWTAQGSGNYRLSIDVQVKASIPPVPYFRNTAFLNYTDEKGFSWPTRIASADVAFSGPVISLVKSSAKTLVHSKETIVYQITMQNTGDPSKTLWVNDTLPTGMTYVSDSAMDLGSAFRGRVVSGNSLYIRLGDMPSLQTWSFTVTTKAATNLAPGAILVNVVSLNYTNSNGFLLPPRVTTWAVQVSAPEILSAAVSLGRTQVTPADIIRAAISFTNTGSEAARDAWVNLTLGPGLIYLNATLVPLLNGGEVHFTLSNVPLGPTTIFLNASVDFSIADHWTMMMNGTLTYTDGYRNVLPSVPIVSDLIEASVPIVILRVSPATTSIEADSLVFYSIYLVNAGSGMAGDVQLSLPLPASFLYVSNTSDGALSIVGSTYTWRWTNVTPGSKSFSLELRAKSTVRNGTRANLMFHADYTDVNGNFRPGVDASAIANFVASQIDMQLGAPSSDSRVGETLQYTLRIRNLGGSVAHDLWLVYTNNSHFEIVTYTSTVEAVKQDLQLNWSFTDVQPSQVLVVTLDLRIRDGTPTGLSLPVVFEVLYTNSADTVIGYSRVDVTMKVLADPFTYVWIGLAGSGLAALLVLAVIRRFGTQIEEVFLVYRDGVLLYHLSRSLSQDKDEDVLSGMLTAVTEFVRDAFVYGEHFRGLPGLP